MIASASCWAVTLVRHKIAPLKSAPPQIRLYKICPLKMCIYEVCVFEIRAFEVCLFQMHPL